MADVYWCYELPPLEEATSVMMSIWGLKMNRILVGCISRLSTIFKTLTLIAGILTQLPKSDVISGWMEKKLARSFAILYKDIRYKRFIPQQHEQTKVYRARLREGLKYISLCYNV